MWPIIQTFTIILVTKSQLINRNEKKTYHCNSPVSGCSYNNPFAHLKLLSFNQSNFKWTLQNINIDCPFMRQHLNLVFPSLLYLPTSTIINRHFYKCSTATFSFGLLSAFGVLNIYSLKCLDWCFQYLLLKREMFWRE